MALRIDRSIDRLRVALAAGKRLVAAEVALQEAKNATPERLREMVGLMAAALRELGDRHEKRGRPVVQRHSWQHYALLLAQRQLDQAVIARCLLDGDEIGPKSLAELLFHANLVFEQLDDTSDVLAAQYEFLAQSPEAVAAARTAAMPYARQVLVELGLANVPRQGFRAEFKRRLIERNRIHTGTKKLTAPKVSR